MASIRNLKKDINYLTNELLSECYMYTKLHPTENHDKVEEITHAIMKKRNEIVYKVHHVEKKNDPKAMKSHYKMLLKECGEMIGLLDSLRALQKK